MVDAFDSGKSSTRYKRGSLVFRQGELGRGLYCISSGRVKLYRANPAGQVQVVSLAGPGDFLGHRELLTGQPQANTAEVVQEALICLVERDVLLASLQEDRQVAQNVMTSMAHALERAEARMLELARLSASGRIASLLLECEDQGQVAPLTREELAQIAGTTIESVSRTLRSLGRKGVLGLKGRRIRIIDRGALEELTLGRAPRDLPC